MIWKTIKQYYTRYKISHNYHYWNPIWLGTEPTLINKYKNIRNNDELVPDDEIIQRNRILWPPGYHGHRCIKCGEIRIFKSSYALRKLKTKGCTKLN